MAQSMTSHYRYHNDRDDVPLEKRTQIRFFVDGDTPSLWPAQLCVIAIASSFDLTLINVIRVAATTTATATTRCVAQFSVSAALGSAIGGMRCVCATVPGRHAVIANHRNVVEFQLKVAGFSTSYHLSNIVDSAKSCVLLNTNVGSSVYNNAKWFVYFRPGGRTLGIANTLWEPQPNQHINSPTVEFPVVELCGKSERESIFFSQTYPDEGVVCTITNIPGGTDYIVALTKLQLERSWSTKKLTVLSSTRFQAKVDRVYASLLLFKKAGAMAFILCGCSTPQPEGGRRLIFQVDEGATTDSTDTTNSVPVLLPMQQMLDNESVSVSQLSSSLFCTVSIPVVEIWDINHTTTGRSLMMIELTGPGHSLVAEGGLFICSTRLRGGEATVEVTDPLTGAQILTISGIRSAGHIHDTVSSWR
ncbi:hypothetical protein Pelo_13748 [Pelomyxa schiedti]|nr:hypothetical protein Pelo_13748 [Pelomyxa schiedti]